MKAWLAALCLLLTIGSASGDSFEEQIKQIPECSPLKSFGICNLRNDLNIDQKIACGKTAIQNEKICNEKSKPIREAMGLQNANVQP